MSVRHAVLSIGAVLVLGLGVYLWIAVRAPADPPASGPREARAGRERAPEPTRPAAATPAVRDAAAAPAPAPAAPRGGPALAAGDPAAGRAAELVAEIDALSGPRLDAVMDEANKAYDRGDLDDAKAIAARLLARQPGNVRMLRIMVSASCIDGDSATAQASYAKLPPPDQAQMRIRCARYGVSFADKP